MCSVGEDNFDEGAASKYMPLKESFSLFSTCNKCRVEPPCILLRSKDKYCKACFLAGTVHKFKSLLGKHKLVRPTDKVLVIHKCGHPTSALLHFLRSGLDLDTHKKLRFSVVVVFIEDLYHLSVDERRKVVKNVQNEVCDVGFPLYFAPLTEIASKSIATLSSQAESLRIGSDDAMELKKCLQTHLKPSDRNDVLKIKTRKLWIDIATKLKCKFIFVPDISMDIAAQLLSDISLGRGTHVPLDTGFCDDRDEVRILRPLRLFDVKELAFYNHIHRIQPVVYKTSYENPYKSVQNLMKKFVNDLQVNYPATITTVLKTGDKLSIDYDGLKRCSFCNAPQKSDSAELTSAESTQFSHWASTQPPLNSLTSEERYKGLLESFSNLCSVSYCYACRKLMNA